MYKDDFSVKAGDYFQVSYNQTISWNEEGY